MPESLNLVFDLDGTLIDSAPQIHAASNYVFRNIGLPDFPQETVRGFIGNGVGVLVERLMAYQGLGSDAELHAELAARFINIYEEAFDLTSLYPGVSTALDALSDAGHRLGICTNKPEGPTRAVLRHFDLAAHFPVIVGGDSLPQRKPDPAPLRAVLQAMGPAPSLFIGDSEVDAETAQAAGVPLVLFSGGYRKAAPEALKAKLIFDTHAALPCMIAQLALRL